MWTIGQLAASDTQGQRQPAAHLDDAARRLRLGGDPVRSGRRGQQHQRVRGRQHVQIDPMHALQPTEAAATRDQDAAVPSTGPQLPNLPGVGRVVQYHQDPLISGHRAVQSRTILEIIRYGGRCDTERGEYRASTSDGSSGWSCVPRKLTWIWPSVNRARSR